MHFRKTTKVLRAACRIAFVYYSRRVVQS
ncbi:MAG: hypothetical protein RL033_6441, partial [Pseudomonadota bacterium]